MKPAKLFVLVSAAAMSGMIAVWAASSFVARPVQWPVDAPGPPAQSVNLTSSDGKAIAGTYWPGRCAAGPAVLLLHGINTDRMLFRKHATWLNEIGYSVLAIDFRGHGASQAAERTFGWHEARDASAAFAFLKRSNADRKVGVIGVSLGGAAALLGASGPVPADGLVSQGVYPNLRTAIRNRLERSGSPRLAALFEPLLSYQSYPRYGVAPDRIAPVEALKSFKGAVFVIGGTADRDTTRQNSHALFAAASGAKKLWLVAGADHVQTSKLWTVNYRREVAEFFAAHLGRPDLCDARFQCHPAEGERLCASF
jgi:dipeptidyl aminopeptidase/acylaminoacyl peptidase